MKRRARMVPLGAVLGDVAGAIDRRGGLETVRAAQAWERVCGTEVSRHTRPGALREGELVVNVDSSAWAQELSLLAPRYVAALREDLGEELVRAVRFVVSPRVGRQAAREHERAKEEALGVPQRIEPVALTDAERSQVDSVALRVKDGRLRQALKGAMTRHLEWQKARSAENGGRRRNKAD